MRITAAEARGLSDDRKVAGEDASERSARRWFPIARLWAENKIVLRAVRGRRSADFAYRNGFLRDLVGDEAVAHGFRVFKSYRDDRRRWTLTVTW